jgi:hypothetical protein
MLTKGCDECVQIARWTRQCLLHSEPPRFRPQLVRSSRSFRNCLRVRGMHPQSCSSTGPGMAPGAGTNSFSTISPLTALRRTRSVFERMAQVKGELSCIAAASGTMSMTLRRWRTSCRAAPFWLAIRWAALLSRNSLRRGRLRRRFCSPAFRPAGRDRCMRGSCAIDRSTCSKRTRRSVSCRSYRTRIERSGFSSLLQRHGMTPSDTIASCRTSRCSVSSIVWRSIESP